MTNGFNPPPAIDDTLAAAFALTNFEVRGTHPITLRVRNNPEVIVEASAWLDTVGARSAVVITAWGPFGQAREQALNEQANQALLAHVMAAGLTWQPARGVSTTDDWYEDSYCVFDVSQAQVDAWLQRFDQHAVLRVRHGEAPTLLWHPDHGRG